MTKTISPSVKVRSPSSLWYAWRQVYQSGIKSRSEETQNEVNEFNKSPEKNISRIYKLLLNKKYKFSPSRGVPIDRENKSPRPIVVKSVEDRIVSRSILDTLQSINAIRPFFTSKYSFGGIKDHDKDVDRGVAGAISAAHKAIVDGATYYIRSDINSFFTKIPKDVVLNKISSVVDENEFNGLLKSAITVELVNLDKLGKKSELFPLYEIGVAQGCCLSPLLGNILLSDFDSEMNSNGRVCLRYIDDFLILGNSRDDVLEAFSDAKQILNNFSMTVYDPVEGNEKAKFGMVKDSFEFLGCKYTPGLISPNQKSRNRVIKKIDQLIDKSLVSMKNPGQCKKKGNSLVATLGKIDNILKGWGNQYSFCNNRQVMEEMDHKIDQKIGAYLAKYKNIKDGFSGERKVINRRRIMGIHNIGADSKKKYIIKNSRST